MTFNALLDANFKTKPWRHQLDEFETSAEMPARALLWQMRSGKTKIIIDTACHLFTAAKIDTLLIFAPNGVHENWVVKELPVHMWDNVPYTARYWRTRVAGRKGGNRLSVKARAEWEETFNAWWADMRLAAESKDLLVITVNSESMTRDDIKRLVARLVKKRKLMVVWDESGDFRTPGSARTKMSRALARRVPYRRILDGTSSHNSPLHLFSQFELLHKSALGFDTYEEFKEHFAVYEEARGAGGRKYEKLKEYRNLDELRNLMAPLASVVLREDCSDMPLVVPQRRFFEMTKGQVKAYEEMEERLLNEIDGEDVPLNAMVAKVMKFQQIVSGFVIDSDKKVHTIPGGNPRLEALSDEVFLAPGPVIIWCQFHEDMDRVMARMKLDGWSAVEYSGRVTPEAKLQARVDYQTGSIKALIGHPRAGGRGVELSAASKIIWYSHTFDAILRAQADERATKMGGGNVQLIDLYTHGVDEYILGRLAEKISIADDVAGRGLKAVLQGVRL